MEDLTIGRYHLTAVNDDRVADDQFGRRNLDHRTLLDDPRRLRLELKKLARGPFGTGGGQVANPIAQADQPSDEASGHHVTLADGGGDGQRVEKIDIEAALPAPHHPCPPKNG